MKIIAITGPSGSGKSTLSSLLTERLKNSKYLNGDKIFGKVIEIFNDKFKQMFGQDAKPWHFEREPEKGKEFVESVLEPINTLFEYEILKADDEGYEYCLIDWVALPSLDVWDKAYYRVGILSDTKERHKHLYDRMKERFKDVTRDKGKNRDIVFNSFLNSGHSPDINVFNDYSEGIFEKSIEKIINSIYEKKFVKKRSIPKDTKCLMCSCYLNRDLEKRYISDTVLMDSGNFFVMPTCLAFTPCYFLLLPKRHINSLAYLTDEEFKEFEVVSEKIRVFLKGYFGFAPMIFEHGVAETKNQGIVHDHVHFVPIKFDASKMVKEFKMTKIENLDDVRKLGKNKNYLYIQDNKGNMYFTETGFYTMDAMKKEVVEQFGDLNAWFYPLEEYEENIKKSIDIWKNNFVY
jgi:diadenosine tetraphosphate (Ap4A) HIT family hydrolase